MVNLEERCESRTLTFQKNYLLQLKPFEGDEKCFLFHLKNSFRSQDIHDLVNKQLQYRYCPISLEEKTTRQ